MPRRRRSARARKAPASTGVWAFLTDAPPPEGPGHAREDFDALRFFGSLHVGGQPVPLRAVWDEHQAEILVEWRKARPGTRPSTWWWFHAPGTLAPRPLIHDRQAPSPEAQLAFLREHGLLTDEERNRLEEAGRG